MTELKPTNLIAVEVAKDAHAYDTHNGILYYWQIEEKDKTIHLGFPFKILGEVSKDKIGFDVEPYVEKVVRKNEPVYYKFYNNEDSIATTDKSKSFYSLLAANELYFENPVDEPETEYDAEGHPYYPLQEYEDEWQSFEDKLIKGKLLILEKI